MIVRFSRSLERKLENGNNLDLKNAITFLHSVFRSSLPPGPEVLVDATCGKGHDTVFLQSLGEVVAMDIQQEALEEAGKRLLPHRPYTLVLDSHEHMLRYVRASRGILFNLGYLPGGDKSICTKADITIKGIKAGLSLLVPGGLMGIVLYPGHPAGLEEEKALREFLRELPQKEYHVMISEYPNRVNCSPYPVLIQKIPQERILK